MERITPFLWFDGQAERAARFYVSVFGNSRIDAVTRYGKGAPRPSGSVMTVAFRLAGQRFIALNGGPQFTFNEAVSFVVTCRTQREIDHYWRKLTRGGKAIQCGWLKDRFGLCWQVVPANLSRLLDGRHPDRAARVMEAIMGMVKLDIAALERAHAGRPARAAG
jgi:predicted 3-demethylubiquinone-9 3-methyltransferase (glyoxalase superfamily)